MTFSWDRAMTIARREYVFTVTRKAFLLTLIGTPIFYVLLMFIMIKPQMDEAMKSVREFKTLAVVDSSGAFHDAPRELKTEVRPDRNPFQRRIPGAPLEPQVPVQTFVTNVKFFDDQTSALDALRRDEVKQVLVVPADYLATGRLRRYAKSENLFTDDQNERPVTRWMVRGLLSGHADSTLIERAVRPSSAMDVYTLNKQGEFTTRGHGGEAMDFLVPFIAALLLSMSIVIGGQYLLQGVSEEKESRILESMLCSVTPEDLVVGKLIGLGSAGLTLVGSWIAMGAALGGGAALAMKLPFSATAVVLMVVYFILGYLFYASLMTGIGAITNNMREAQQFSFMFTFMNFIPFYMMTSLIGHPESGLAIGLSLFPPTAPVSMLLRITSPSANVPPWQIALSIALLVGTAWLAVRAAAKVFRIGLLMYGKTPTLPEILRWVSAR